MSGYPREFRVDTKPRQTRYVLAEEYYAVYDAAEDRQGPDVIFHLEEEHVAVCRKRAGVARAGPEIGPVYRIGDRGPLAVPTGRLFVRCAESKSLEDHRREIEEAGFNIVETLSYAPQAGWLEASSGEIADAIHRFKALGRISGIEAVEPQMLMERQTR